MMETLHHWAWIVFTLLAWIYIGGIVFLLGPAFSLSEMKCAYEKEKDKSERRKLGITIHCMYVWISLYPIGFIALILHHSGVLIW